MNLKVQTACAWCGPLFVVTFFTGMIIAGFFPPISANDDASMIADLFRDDTDRIRVGLVLMMVSAVFTVPLGAVVAVQLKRIEGAESPLTFIQIVGAATGMLAITIPVFIWMAASFRPERAPEVTQTLNDLAWIPFIINFPPALLQCVSIGTAVLTDRSDAPPYPRWVAYFNFWCALLFLPAGLLLFFTTGPFAWHGLIVFWVPATLFGSWFLVMAFMTRRAIALRARQLH